MGSEKTTKEKTDMLERENKTYTKGEADALSREFKELVLKERGVSFAETDSDDYLVNNIMYSNRFI